MMQIMNEIHLFYNAAGKAGGWFFMQLELDRQGKIR